MRSGLPKVRPMGPGFNDFAKVIQGSQGTMGIVTWASVGCRPLPKIKKTFLVPSDDINGLIDLTYKILWKKLESFTNNLTLGIDAGSPGEMAFKERCLKRIIEKFGGKEIKESAAEMGTRFLHGYNGLGAVKGTMRATGGLGSQPNALEAHDNVRITHERGFELKDRYSKDGYMMDDGDSPWVTIVEDFGAHMEVPLRFTAKAKEDEGKSDSKSNVRTQHRRDTGPSERHLNESNQMVLDEHLGIPDFESDFHRMSLVKEMGYKIAGPLCYNYHIWTAKLKKMLDPNMVSEHYRYPTPKAVGLEEDESF